ncbi:hypothetical protein F5890DRAFT_1478333 [Lentinula detonsa]|uniref:BED-type domain-containing protein n=1 Tax=Lentinula detonsa TaxID=2804962 RepID=A0AA38UMP3_9AGAR|nr:hypothetical protein F5890DRAFT_1478333 [Lentinula detonsa]
MYKMLTDEHTISVAFKSSSRKVWISREDMDVSSEEDSNGQSALRKIEEVEQVQRGPKSNTRDFWTEHLVTEKGKLKCKCCMHKVTFRQFPATARCNSFDEQCPKPNLSNLTTHLNQVHPDHNNTESPLQDPAEPQTASQEANTAFLQWYIDQGKLNPEIEATQKGFLQMFSAWVFEDGLPFTTGKSKGLQRLFEYLKIKFALPTDTTVRCTLDTITKTLHWAVVKELLFIKRLVDFQHLEKQQHAACDTLAETLGKLLFDRYSIHFHPKNNQIQCLAHIVNLIVQAILKALDEADSSDDIDYFLHKDLPMHYDEDEDEELKEMESEVVHKNEAQIDSDTADDDLPPNVGSMSVLKRVWLISIPFFFDIHSHSLIASSHHYQDLFFSSET